MLFLISSDWSYDGNTYAPVTEKMINDYAAQGFNVYVSDTSPDFYKHWQTTVPTDGEITVYHLTLDECKEVKLAELAKVFSAYEDNLVNNDIAFKSSLGFTVNADMRSQNNIRALIAIGDKVTNFKDFNNVNHELSQTQLKTLLSEMSQNNSYLYDQKWDYKYDIQGAKSTAELDKLKFTFKVKEYSL